MPSSLSHSADAIFSDNALKVEDLVNFLKVRSGHSYAFEGYFLPPCTNGDGKSIRLLHAVSLIPDRRSRRGAKPKRSANMCTASASLGHPTRPGDSHRTLRSG